LHSKTAIANNLIKGLKKAYPGRVKEDYPRERFIKLVDYEFLFKNKLAYTLKTRVLKKTKGVLFRASVGKRGRPSKDNRLQRHFKHELQVFNIQQTHENMMHSADEIWDIIMQNYTDFPK
jgi:hypothetical protein